MQQNNHEKLIAAVDDFLDEFPGRRSDPMFLEAAARTVESGRDPEITDPTVRRLMAAEFRRRALMLRN
jgi:hypothetical protein